MRQQQNRPYNDTTLDDRYKDQVSRDGLSLHGGFGGRQGPLSIKHYSKDEKKAQFGLQNLGNVEYQFNPSLLDPYTMDVNKQIKDLNSMVRTN